MRRKKTDATNSQLNDSMMDKILFRENKLYITDVKIQEALAKRLEKLQKFNRKMKVEIEQILGGLIDIRVTMDITPSTKYMEGLNGKLD